MGADIATSAADELAFTHSVLCQTSLPAGRPPDGMLTWERQQGRARLLIEAGKALNPATGKYVQLGLPYGPKSRLLLMHLNSEAIRRQSPIIPVEDSMTAFFRRVMGSTQDGRQVRMLKQQLSALAAAQFRMGIAESDRAFQLNTQVVTAFDLWLNKDEAQRTLWPATLRLSLDYYESLAKFAVPLDERAIAGLSHSAVALDIYCWLAQRLHRIPPGKPQLVPWPSLHEQFGQGYTRLRKFREFFLGLLPQVNTAYPAAEFEIDNRGMMLYQSEPPVLKRLSVVRAIGGALD
jgi:Plasmid encoded RepA protein